MSVIKLIITQLTRVIRTWVYGTSLFVAIPNLALLSLSLSVRPSAFTVLPLVIQFL